MAMPINTVDSSRDPVTQSFSNSLNDFLNRLHVRAEFIKTGYKLKTELVMTFYYSKKNQQMPTHKANYFAAIALLKPSYQRSIELCSKLTYKLS